MANRLILIDGRDICRRRGMGHFLRELLFIINEGCVESDERFVCAVPRGTAADYVTQYPNIRLLEVPRLDQISWEQLLIPLTAAVLHADYLIAPNISFPIFLPRRCKCIAVIHDLIFLRHGRHSAHLKLKIGNAYRSFCFRHIEKCHRVLTVSAFTSELLSRFRKIPAQILENGVRHLQPLIDSASRHSPRPHRYFLHIGGDAGTKNTARVVRAYQHARRRAEAPFPNLLIMGTSESFGRALARANNAGDEIEVLPSVSDADKCNFLRHMEALVFPSLQEGFGIPLLEAQAFGKIAITSRRRPLSDFASPRDYLVCPLSEAQIANALLDISQQDVQTMTPRFAISQNQYEILSSIL